MKQDDTFFNMVLIGAGCIGLVCIAAMIAVPVYGASRLAGRTSERAATVAAGVLGVCCVVGFALQAFAKWRCPEGCSNILRGPDKIDKTGKAA